MGQGQGNHGGWGGAGGGWLPLGILSFQAEGRWEQLGNADSCWQNLNAKAMGGGRVITKVTEGPQAKAGQECGFAL